MQNLSADTLKDPTHTKWIEDEFAEKITKLFEKVKPKLTALIGEKIGHTEVLVHKSIPKPGDLKTLLPKVDTVFQEEVIKPAQEIFEVEIPKAYKAGNAWGSIQLGAPYEERRILWEKVSGRITKAESEFQNVTDATAGRIRSTIGDGIINERKMSDIARDIVRGVDDVGIVRATAMVRTETMRAVNGGIVDRYQRDGIEMGEWLTATDGNQCDECDELDGKQFPLDQFPDCPAHPNCRCTITPVIEIPEGD